MEQLDGVLEAQFFHPQGEGVVTFDTTTTSVEAIVARLERMTDFTASEGSRNDE